MLDSKIITLLKLEKAGSYTKAAHELHLTQPAISRHIRLLEEELGIKIFQHGTKKLLPTREGKILLRYAHRPYPKRRYRPLRMNAATQGIW